MRFTFLDSPTPDQIRQILSIYIAEEWWVASRDDADLVKRIVAGSHCFLVVEDGKRVVGMGRAISDGVSDAYIQDVAVDANVRDRGIGSEIIRRLLSRLNRDGVNWVGLIAERGSHPFYQRLGFKVMPDATPMNRISGLDVHEQA